MERSTYIGLGILLLIILVLWFTPIVSYVSTNQKDIRELDARAGERSPVDLSLKEEPDPRIIVSLTTIPSRIENLRIVVKSLLNQTMPPDEIAINIPWKTLKGDEYVIPEWLVGLNRVRIYRMEQDMGPASKLLPTLKREHPDTKIIVGDDDYAYAPRHVERLVKFSNEHPEAAITAYSKNLIYSRDKTQPPRGGQSWVWMRSQTKRESDILLGCFGFLVKPRFFTDKIFDYTDVPEEAFWVDDIWFSGNLLLEGREILSPPFDMSSIALPLIRQLKTEGLIRGKNKGGRNDNRAIEYFWAKGLWSRPGHPRIQSE